jgi:hypothetical protein
LGVLMATAVTEVIDLDVPRSGMVRIDLTPLQTQIESMR